MPGGWEEAEMCLGGERELRCAWGWGDGSELKSCLRRPLCVRLLCIPKLWVLILMGEEPGLDFQGESFVVLFSV